MNRPLRALPGVDRVLSDERVERLVERYSRKAVLGLVRLELDEARRLATDGIAVPTFDEMVSTIESRASFQWRSWPNTVINATGVILHTNLGRAPLSHDATEAMRDVSIGYSDLELDLETGRRGSRQAHVARLLCQLTGAEAALAVNNNASGLLVGLAAASAGREVIVSRGEAIEIGGGFRIPDVLRESGATLVEVGTTNRSYISDFESAITESTGAILSVHASNFRMSGFTHAPRLSELVELGKRCCIPVLHDLGSGSLLDTSLIGLAHEPTPQESVQAGASLGFFSGDKLLGGPQAGLIVGERDLVDAVSRHPLARAVRIDKLSMAALAATLLHYVKGEAAEKIPVWRMLSMPISALEETANLWRERLGPRAAVDHGQSTIGGGSLPGETLPTWLVRLETSGIDGGADGLARRLRGGKPSVVARIEEECLLLDPRTVLPEEKDSLVQVVTQALAG